MGRFFDPKLGVYSSPRLVADGEPVPRGGGSYLVGHPYTIGGRAYYPSERPDGYTVVGMASWYGDAFHGRRTANGEIFDKNSISAAHPTLPLPSYVRVTNTGNGRSMIVRVNDRGPYHGGRVMDVSQRVAEALNFKSQGTARIKVEYVGRAGLRGSDDDKLMATLRSDGGPAQLDGIASGPTMVASDDPPADPSPAAPQPMPMTRAERIAPPDGDPNGDSEPARVAPRRRMATPVPPQRPYDISSLLASPDVAVEPRPSASTGSRPMPRLPPKLVSFAPTEPIPRPPTRLSRSRRPPTPWRDAGSEN